MENEEMVMIPKSMFKQLETLLNIKKGHNVYDDGLRRYYCEKFASEVAKCGFLDIEDMQPEHVMGAMMLWCCMNGVDLEKVKTSSGHPLQGTSNMLSRLLVNNYGYYRLPNKHLAKNTEVSNG